MNSMLEKAVQRRYLGDCKSVTLNPCDKNTKTILLGVNTKNNTVNTAHSERTSNY